MSARRRLFDRLPEIYQEQDKRQTPPGQLEAYLASIDDVLQAVHDSVEHLYHDQFIETCDTWVVPYIADLLGTTHLSGDPWTLRADVARTVFHRRRKGTLGAIESLTFTLSGWAAHAIEMRERLAWAQHLNHQRPDAGGKPPLSLATSMTAAMRGGTVTLRDPGLLSLAQGPFDPFAHVVDVKPPTGQIGASAYNLPNLAIFLWRLEDYRVPVSRPVSPATPNDIIDLTPAPAGLAAYSVRFNLHPLGEPMVLFNAHRFRADEDPPNLSVLDEVPGPMPAARLTEDRPAGLKSLYIRVSRYGGAPPPAPTDQDPGLTLHVPEDAFPATQWKIRGANLCAWEDGLRPELGAYEIAVDPVRGRIVFGVMKKAAEARVLRNQLLVSATYGFSGPTGAHPVSRPTTPASWLDEAPEVVRVSFHTSETALSDALADLADAGRPFVIEIDDSMTHDLDIAAVVGSANEAGQATLRLGHSLWIRAVGGQRPVIRLARPLSFRPDVVGTALEATLTVKLEGLYITRAAGFDAAAPLIARAALNELILEGCTLDPDGHVALDGSASGARQPIRDAAHLTNDYGFAKAAEERAFEQKPKVTVRRSITGPLAIDSDYALELTDSIVDAGSGVEALAPAYAIHAVTGSADTEWGPELTVQGLTCFGRVRVESVTGRGAIFVQRLEAHDNQQGCVRFSYFSGDEDRIPPHHGCVFGTQAVLAFTSEIFGVAGYGQIASSSDVRILENGPERDQMGAFGSLRNTAKWKNLNIRYREFMPVGVRAVLFTVT